MTPLIDPAPESAGDNVRGYALNIIAAGVIVALLYWARIVFITISLAVIVALILEPFVGFLVKIRVPRATASLIVCAVALLALYFTGLAAYRQLSSIASDFPAFKENLATFAEGISDRMQSIEESSARLLSRRQQAQSAPQPAAAKKNRKSTAPPTVAVVVPPATNVTTTPGPIPEVRIHNDPITDYVYSQLGALYQIFLMGSFVPLLVYFMLSWRDHIYKTFLRFFDGAGRTTASRSLEGVALMARAFVVGNFVIGVILASISTALFAVIHLQYPFLAGSLSGFLSLVPYAGIVLAAIPPVLAALATGAPTTIILFGVLIVLALHLIALNVFYPILVGARVHLNPLAVTLSLMFFGFIWDAAGLVLAIPITAGLKAVCDNVDGLKNYGRLLGD
jgi:predicted PurR-regulated permease PerM